MDHLVENLVSSSFEDNQRDGSLSRDGKKREVVSIGGVLDSGSGDSILVVVPKESIRGLDNESSRPICDLSSYGSLGEIQSLEDVRDA